MHAHYFKHFSGFILKVNTLLEHFLRHNSDPGGYSGNDQRILGGLKFSISGFFGVGKFFIVWGSVI